MADKLAKACCDKISKSLILSELTGEIIAKWETDCHNINNGKVAKLFFPYVRYRPKTKLKVLSGFTAVLTGHGKPKLTFSDSVS